MQIFIRLIHLPGIILKVLYDVWRQKRFLKTFIQPILNDYDKRNDGSLDKEDFRKITHYYGFGVPAVLAESFATLRGQKLSNDERLASTYQGAATGLFDDFFDKKQIPIPRINEILTEPQTIECQNLCEELSIFFYTRFLEKAFNRELITRTIHAIHQNQVNSLRQKNQQITFDEMMQTTFDKGGNSVLFYRALLAPPVKPEEEEAIYQMGATMQLGNDIFDVYKDAKDQISTIITTNTHIAEVRKVYARQMLKAFKLFAALDYPQKNKQKVLRKILFGISRVFVALDQYEKLEVSSGGKFQVSAYARKALICDMEKPKNIWKSITYYLTYQME